MQNSSTTLVIKQYAVYARVSTKQQATDNQWGLKIQIDKCLEHIKNDINYKNQNVYIIEEIGSSYNNQNALKKQDKYLEIMEEGTAIIIYSIDRLGRNVYQTSRVCEKVELKKSYIISVTEKTCLGINRLTDQLFFQKLIEAEMFSNMLSERAKSRIKLLKENGEYIGKAPWGKMCIKDANNKRILVDNPPEQELIAKLKVSLITQKKSFYEVHRDLIGGNVLNQFWPICKLKNIVKKYFTSEEKKKINYNHQEFFNEPVKKRNNNQEDEIEQIGNNFKRRVQIN